jgi:hypothetical protein
VLHLVTVAVIKNAVLNVGEEVTVINTIDHDLKVTLGRRPARRGGNCPTLSGVKLYGVSPDLRGPTVSQRKRYTVREGLNGIRMSVKIPAV